MPKLTDDELALIATACRSYSSLLAGDAKRMDPTMARAVQQRSDEARAMAERFERARKERSG